MKRITFLSIAFLVLFFLPSPAQTKQFTHTAILSFENGISPAQGDANSQLSVTGEHFKHLNNSLVWKWNAPKAQWNIKQNIDYKPRNMKSKDNSVSTFVFWVYAKNPVKSEKLKIEFLKNGKVCSFFEYGLDFTGWRGAWLSFDRDMQGKPETAMDEMRVTAPNTPSGELIFDHIILSSLQDVRQHTADFQAPYINPGTENHWLILLRSWNQQFDIPTQPSVTPEEKKSIQEIQNRLTSFLLEGKKAVPLEQLTESVKAYQIRTNPDGSLNGLPVFQDRYGETYEYLGAPDYKVLLNNPMGLSSFTKLLLNMGVSYHRNKDKAEKDSIANMFVLLMKHMLDQGFQAGSALGTLHHLGYNIRDYYTAALLMKEPLTAAKIDQQVQQSMEWFAGTGEIKINPTLPGMNIDAFNTSLIARLASILMLKNTPEKSRYMTAFTRWIDNGFLYTEGTEGAFKPDGSIFHHRGNYPAYAIGGLEGAVTANYLLYNTLYQLKPSGRQVLKNALLSMRNYCNLQTWPLSLSGRHPDGKGHLIPEHYALMALSGSTDYSQSVDKELAAAYMRLETRPTTKYIKKFKELGIEAEKAPAGNWTFNYSCLNVHRRDNWMVSAMGHSRYLWSTEIYVGANLYGRYLNHGNLQILGSGDPISNQGSGFNQQGWDWNHFPGTTATVLPMKELRANVKNLDAESGYEEMLLSDETFAGGLSFQQNNGLFAMKLHENPKYNGTLKARKSYFFFDNRIVALGTGIQSSLPGKPVNTTLFQVYLPGTETTIGVNGENISTFPYSARLEKGKQYLSDGLNNYFFVKKGDVIVSKSLQHSFDEETDEPTQNNFALAAIDHGVTPRNADYEYMVLVQPDEDILEKTVDSFKSAKKSPYQVIRQDSAAHIVFDKTTKTTGYALFEAGNLNTATDILYNSMPCMIMTSKSKKLTLSITDPDLHFYEGNADIKYDAEGKPIERSIHSMLWVNNASAVSEVEIKIKGIWKIAGTSDYFRIKNTENGNTTLIVKCQHGMSREVVLE